MRLLVVAVLLGLVNPLAAEELRSGLQVGESLSQFNVKDCTGPASGKTLCYYCRYGDRPVVGIFVRSIDTNVERLIKRIDMTVDSNRDQRMAAFVVYLSKDGFAAEKKLKALAAKYQIRKTPLTLFKEKDDKLTAELKLSPNANVTVLMWVRSNVRVNHAFSNGQLQEESLQQITADTKKILR